MKKNKAIHSDDQGAKGHCKAVVIDQPQTSTQPPKSLQSEQTKHAANISDFNGNVLQGAFSIEEFCRIHGGITRQHFHAMIKRGQGPRTFKVGRRTLVSRHAASEWVIGMEFETANSMPEAG